MRILKSHWRLAASALVLAVAATSSDAQQDGRAPIIRISSLNGPGVASNYVSPVIDLGEDAYVFAVSIDLDGQIRVLHPDDPGISVRLRQDQQFRLPNFFAGYSASGGGVVAAGRYSSYSGTGEEDDTRGTVIALASRRPFDLARVEHSGDWNIAQIRNLVQYRSPLAAAEALASYLGMEGQPIGRDYLRFASVRPYQYSGYADALYSCDLYYGAYNPGLSLNRIAVLDRVGRMRAAGQSVRILGYDFCGMPIVAYGPSRLLRHVNPRPPRQPEDTGKTRRSQEFPRQRGKGDPRMPQAALGYLPVITRTTEPPRVITSPSRSHAAGEVLIDNRNRPITGPMPERSANPIERATPPRTPAAATGTIAPREYPRPITRESAPPPRVEPTRTASPPPRVETPRYNPPPRIYTAPARVESKPVPPPPKK